MFNKPFDMVWMVVIAGLVVATFGLMIESAITEQGVSVPENKKSFFNNATEYMSSGSFVKGTGDSAAEALLPDEGAEPIDSQDSILTQGFNSMLSLGQTYKAATAMMNEGQTILGIPPIYITTVVSALLITMFIIIYTWIRGR